MKSNNESVKTGFHWMLLVFSLSVWLHFVPSIFFLDVLRIPLGRLAKANAFWLIGGSAVIAGFIAYYARQKRYVEITLATLAYVMTMGFVFPGFWDVQWLFSYPLRVLGVVFVSSALSFSGAWIGRVVWLLGQRTEVSQK